MQEWIEEIAQALGYTYKQTTNQPVCGISIDSRSVQAGDLFVALVGEHSDGHHYLQQALQQGAAAVVVSKPGTS